MGLSPESAAIDVFNTLRPGFVFYAKSGKKYVLISKLGEGGMGAVYKAEDMETVKEYAIKCEKYNRHRIMQRKGLRLAMEKMIMKICHKSAHIPDYRDAGRTDTFGWIAMELVGESLASLRKTIPNHKFSTVTVLRIGIQVIKGLRDLHMKGFVHRDLKPDNLAIGIGEKRNKIVILDLGIARQFKNVAGVPHRPRLQVKFKGTRHFAPLALQMREEYGPKDDLESLFYILALFHIGYLPWSQMKEDQEIIRIKQMCRDRPIMIFGFSELSQLLSHLWQYTINKSYEDMMDYDYLVNALTTALNRLGSTNLAFDWENLPTEKTQISKKV